MKIMIPNKPFVRFILMVVAFCMAAHEATGQDTGRSIDFPDIPGYRTLKCDLHMHTVFSDGSVWPDIRVREALRDGLDAIALTDHIEVQPHQGDIPHPDRNRSYQIALYAARGSGLIVINGAEITRAMPPGHANAIFVEDVNKLNQEDMMEVFREARRQDAFVFWNHPHWTKQKPDGVASPDKIHFDLFSEGLIQGIEIYNEYTYSDEALQIALDNNLTILGTSDIHGLIDWQFEVPLGGHRPVTLVFAREKSPEALKEALQNRRTAVWFDNTLVGNPQFLVPMIEQSLVAEREGETAVQNVIIENLSDADYIMENRSEFLLHNKASVFTLKAHENTLLQVKTLKVLESFTLRFEVLNAFIEPGNHPEIEIEIK
jgi:hypothetical protein